MAVTYQGTAAEPVNSADTSTIDVTHTVESGTTISMLMVVWRDNEGATPVTISSIEDWDTGQSFVEIHTNSTGDGNDPNLSVWAVVAPTAQANTITVAFSGSSNNTYQGAVMASYAGTLSSTVAAATNLIDTDQNTGSSSTTDLTSGGTAGNALVGCCVSINHGAHPASNAESFTEIVEKDTGGTNAFQDATIYYAHLLDAAPSALTVAWNVSDENTGALIELVADIALPGYHGANRGIMRGVARGVG